RERARHRARDPARAEARPPEGAARQPVRPRRQGHGHGREAPRSVAHVSRIATTFAALRGRGAALIPYFTVGDPDLATTRGVVRAAIAEGADAIELGMPFSDPMADGPVLQRAAVRALAGGMTLPRLLEFVADVRAGTDVPLVLFGYYNPLFR